MITGGGAPPSKTSSPCRVYGLNDESGAVICEWPAGKYKPVIPIPYAEECMHGYEYQAAVHLIQEGMEREGLDIVAGIRNRYTGENRNPWNEMECGSNYARSMASYALLLTYSGFSFDMTTLEIRFAPLRDGAYFWSLDTAWGVFEQSAERRILRVLYGTQRLGRLRLPKQNVTIIRLQNREAPFKQEGDVCVFGEPIIIHEGESLVIE